MINRDNPSYTTTQTMIQERLPVVNVSLKGNPIENTKKVNMIGEQIDPTADSSSDLSKVKVAKVKIASGSGGVVIGGGGLPYNLKVRKVNHTSEPDAVGIEGLEVKVNSGKEKPFRLKTSVLKEMSLVCVQEGYQSRREFVSSIPCDSGVLPIGTFKKKKVKITAENVNKQKMTYDSGYHNEATKKLVGVEHLALCGASQPELIRPKRYMNPDTGYSGYQRNAFRYANYITDGQL